MLNQEDSLELLDQPHRTTTSTSRTSCGRLIEAPVLSSTMLSVSGSIIVCVVLVSGVLRSENEGVHDVSENSKMSSEKIAEELRKSWHENVPDTTCALVFNSGSVLDHEYGPEIDACDYVIRFNIPQLESYEKHVGTRTTHQYTLLEKKHAARLVKHLKRDDGVKYIFSYLLDGQVEKFQKLEELFTPTITNPFQKEHIIRGETEALMCFNFWQLDKAKCRLFLGDPEAQYPCVCSRGADAILWALSPVSGCGTVNIYGFEHNPCRPAHYFWAPTSEQIEGCGLTGEEGGWILKHNLLHEHRHIRDLVEKESRLRIVF